jgi:hypothetical protein
VVVLVASCVLRRSVGAPSWESLDWNDPDSPMTCCDATSVYETDDNTTLHGLPFTRFYANASNTARCNAGFQCIPCLPGIRTVCTCPLSPIPCERARLNASSGTGAHG